jgi:ABC-type uncharacterized transport system substrate-binding protein
MWVCTSLDGKIIYCESSSKDEATRLARELSKKGLKVMAIQIPDERELN